MLKTIFKYIVLPFISIPLLYGVWLLLRAFVFDYFTIPTNSMYPTLKPGYKVVVNKLLMGARIYEDFDFNNNHELKSWRTKGMRPIKHNDIVVFNFPQRDGKIGFTINYVFCKRVMALPGDTLSIVDGYYKNNNYEGVLGLENQQRILSDTPDSLVGPMLVSMPYAWHLKWTIRNFGPLYMPRKGETIRLVPSNASPYRTLLEWEIGKEITWDWDTETVFADGKPIKWHTFQHSYYFMAGDNVMDSSDSRYWGLVPEEYIVGVVDWIIEGEKSER